MNKKEKIINLDRNKRSQNNHNSHNRNYNIFNISPSFLNNVVKKTPNLKNNNYNSLLRHNIIKNSPQSKNIINDKVENTFTETFFTTTNIIMFSIIFLIYHAKGT